MRLYQFLKDEFNLTKTECEEFNITHNVKVNTFGPKWLSYIIKENDIITVDDVDYVPITKKRVYLLYNKIEGIVCTNDRKVIGNIRDHLNYPIRIYPCGRLDKESVGLLLLTNDGTIINQILDSKCHVEKEYHVTVDKELDSSFKSKMEEGIPILGKVTKPCKVKIKSKNSFDITLVEGMNRQIRRMCKYLGYKVTYLCRFRLGNIYLDGIDEDTYREVDYSVIKKLIDYKESD